MLSTGDERNGLATIEKIVRVVGIEANGAGVSILRVSLRRCDDTGCERQTACDFQEQSDNRQLMDPAHLESIASRWECESGLAILL